jgi:dihydropyrimidine dehydrogenase (NAD+) subunit PreT
MCARVCPTEVLCEAGLRAQHQRGQAGRDRPAAALCGRCVFRQARATPLFTRATPTGRTVAVVGAGPAGLACAARSGAAGPRRGGVRRPAKPGGLNEYGLATYKTVDSSRSGSWTGCCPSAASRSAEDRLGRDRHAAALRDGLRRRVPGLGLAGNQRCGIPGRRPGRRAQCGRLHRRVAPGGDPSRCRSAARGGHRRRHDRGRRRGAERAAGPPRVTMVYRRGEDAMSASGHEQDWAQTQRRAASATGRRRRKCCPAAGQVTGVRFARTRQARTASWSETGETFTLAADMVLKAIGQKLDSSRWVRWSNCEGGRIGGRCRRADRAPRPLGRRRLPRRRARPDGGSGGGRQASPPWPSMRRCN